MRVIICGAGQVGYSIARYLSREANDVSVIDSDARLINEINDELDVHGIHGYASHPATLEYAGAPDADMIIAVTHFDEVNMIACQVAHSLFGIPKKIARIREQNYLGPAWSNLFSRAHMPIDVIISPEQSVAEAIDQRLMTPGTTMVLPLADRAVYVVGVLCGENCPAVNTPLRQLSTLFPNLNLSIVAIERGLETIIPGADDQIYVGDEVFFCVDAAHVKRAIEAFGHEEQKARNVVIAGGGNIGLSLAERLIHKHKGLSVKLIEKNEARAREISEMMEEVIVLHGDTLDKDLLREIDIAHVETLIAVTNDDEANILGSVLAKQHGCGRVITLVNNPAYPSLTGPLEIDATVSPRATTISMIMRHVRRGRIKAVYNLHDGIAEIIEAEVSETAELANKKIANITFPEDVRIGAIVRGSDVIMPRGETIIRPNDHMIVLASQGSVHDVEKLFCVQVDLF